MLLLVALSAGFISQGCVATVWGMATMGGGGCSNTLPTPMGCMGPSGESWAQTIDCYGPRTHRVLGPAPYRMCRCEGPSPSSVRAQPPGVFALPLCDTAGGRETDPAFAYEINMSLHHEAIKMYIIFRLVSTSTHLVVIKVPRFTSTLYCSALSSKGLHHVSWWFTTSSGDEAYSASLDAVHVLGKHFSDKIVLIYKCP